MASEDHEILRYSIPVTPELDAMVRHRMQVGGFNSVAEYVRSAMRADLEKAREADLEAELLAGLNSGDGVPVTKDYWQRRRKDLMARLAQQAQDRGEKTTDAT